MIFNHMKQFIESYCLTLMVVVLPLRGRLADYITAAYAYILVSEIGIEPTRN